MGKVDLVLEVREVSRKSCRSWDLMNEWVLIKKDGEGGFQKKKTLMRVESRGR